MAELSRRKMLMTGGALGALGALGMASPAHARPWTWSPAGSVAGSGAGADPRWVWDEEADPLVASLLDRGAVPEVNRLLWDWNRNDQPLPAGLPEDLRAFMERARQLPSWADQGKLEAAAEFNKSRGLYLNLLNGVGGGMLSTAIPKEARAVYYSKGGADMEDRVAKTSILGFAVGSLNAYRPGGSCAVQAVKTRLVHAAVRHLLQQSPHWNGDIPISQEDMLVTWHTLPTFAMRKMREWKVPIDAVRALRVSWRPGTVDGKSDESVLRELKAAELPLGPRPPTPVVEGTFTFAFRSNSALEPNCAIADVRADRAEIWSALKSPIVARQAIAARLGMPPGQVTVHVVEGGGSFGRKLFFDAALEAAEVSQKVGKPVKLMWHRADDSRQGRTHPMATSRVRVAYLGGVVLGYEQRHTSVSTDLGHGLGEIITAMAARLPVGDIGFAQTFFQLSQEMPYAFGVVGQLLSETGKGFNTGSMRNVYSPDVACARELVMDRLAAKTGKDAYRFRRDFLRDDRARAVLARVAEAGEWGRPMPAGTAQGIAFHAEYKSVSAALVEIDCRPETVNRPIRDGVSGPRVTKAVFAVDVGLAVNPRGLEAQMMGGVMDGIALALTAGLHLRDGHFLEASWDNYFYTRQWNSPPDLRIIVMPSTSEQPGGAGELAVAASTAAVACAYGRATGTMPTSFPINHGTLSFTPKPTVPPIPPSPADGLDHAR